MRAVRKVLSLVTSRSLGTKLFVSHCLVAVVSMVTFVLMTLLFNREFAAFLREGGTLASVAPWVVLGAVVGGVVAAGASLFVARRITAPVIRMLAATRRISSGDYSERVPKQEDDELGSLSQSFNAMAGALQDAEYRRREFISDTSHELKTPLATFQGYLEGLIDGVVEPGDETWGLMYAESERMRRLVEDLRQLSNAESEALSLSLRESDPKTLADLAADGMRPLFTEKNVRLEVAYPDAELPAVRADQDRTLQVLANLLSNALRHTPPGGEVAVRLARRGQKEVSFEIRDTGEGIAPKDLPRLFDRFYRVEKSRSREGGGAGIGLSISRALVEAMGGGVWAKSEGPGKGATFTFTLPVASVRAEP